MKKEILIVTGPTGVGKTETILALTKNMPAEIVNADTGQMYAPLSIGTAKPDWQNEKVPHHLFDILDKPENFTAHQYREQAIKLINEIWQRGNTPIFVGGSGFYLQSLLFPPQDNDASGKDVEVVAGKDLWQELFKVDSARAEQLHKNDIYRIQRALQIWSSTGKKPSSFKPVFKPVAPFKLLVLTRERDELYARIDQRVLEMMDEGWISEVENLDSGWQQFLLSKKIIGYEVIIKYLHSDDGVSKEECIAEVQKRVRNYAKRQLTYFRGFCEKLLDQGVSAQNISSFNLTLSDVDLYIKQFLSTDSD